VGADVGAGVGVCDGGDAGVGVCDGGDVSANVGMGVGADVVDESFRYSGLSKKSLMRSSVL
jgi:hypothetical protein